MDNSNKPNDKREGLSQLKADMTNVYDYIATHIDERASLIEGWHALFAADAARDFGLPPKKLFQLIHAIHALASERYGVLYPTPSRVAKVRKSAGHISPDLEPQS